MKIVKVEKVDVNDENVYDLHIDSNHNYQLASGIYAHNSGKGFVLSNLIGLEGKVFDVDALKSLAIKADKINKRVADEYAVSLKDMDLKNQDDVFTLHTIIGDELKLPKKKEQAFFTSVLASAPDRKPNVIFDVTLKDMRKFDSIVRSLTKVGYDKSKIHLVWVVNDIEIAKQQNAKRDRNVPGHILVNTHKGVNVTMQDIISMGDDLRNYMDGDIFFAFNKFKVDSELVKSDNGGKYIKKALYIQMKQVGKAPFDIDSINKDILRKIDAYTPSNTKWER